MLLPGLYEQIINTALNCRLSDILAARKSLAPIDKADKAAKQGRVEKRSFSSESSK